MFLLSSKFLGLVLRNSDWGLFVLEDFDMSQNDLCMCFICKFNTDGSWKFSLPVVLPYS